MLNDDVFILDNYQEVYIWIGNKSNKFERNGARKKAHQYVDGIQDGRAKDTVEVMEVHPGSEPPIFRVLFPDWSDQVAAMWHEEDLLAKMKEKHPTVEAAPEESKENEEFAGFLDPKTNTFPYSELKGAFPQGVKGNKKEYYLSEAEFEEVFKMPRSKYDDLKQWKKDNEKKKHGLF